MNMKAILLTAAVAATGLLFAASASAADGTITFNGHVTASTCTINGGNASFTVTLPTVSVSSLNTAGATAGLTPFSINLTNCTGTLTNVSAYFVPGATINAAGRLSVSGGAAGVDLQLLNAGGSPINLNTLSGNTVASDSSGSATLSYYVQYYATGAITPGAANSSVAYTIQYQ